MTLFLQKSVLLTGSSLRAQLALPDLSAVTEDLTAPEPSLSDGVWAVSALTGYTSVSGL